MLCAISGEPVTNPVLSPKSNTIFEKKNIVNYISTTGTDPISNDPLTIEELIPINTNIKTIVPPITPSNTSIPTLLSTFQNEWDSIVLELFTLRKQLQSARQELSEALYRQDAAVRVAAKAIKERDEAKEALEKLAVSLSVSNGREEQVNVQDKLDSIAVARDNLFKLHKSRKIKFGFAMDVVLELSQVKHLQVSEGALAWDVNLVNKSVIFLDKTGLIEYNIDSREQNEILKESEYSNFSFDSTGIVIAWNEKKLYYNNNILEFEQIISTVICHPTLNIYAVVTNEPSLILYQETTRITTYSLDLEPGSITGNIHVDGEIIVVANGTTIVLVSIITGTTLATLHTNTPIKKLVFALNGYWLFVLTETIELFDLRSTKRIKEFENKVEDFVIDPSSTVLISINNNEYVISRYSKKQKSWHVQDSVSFGESVSSIKLLTTDEEMVKNEPIKIIGVDNELNKAHEFVLLAKE